MSVAICCDAPDCEASCETNSSEQRSWLYASLGVAAPTKCCDELDCDEHVSWQFVGGTDTNRVDACCREHLRIALAHKIAELTDDEQRTPSDE